MLLQIDQNIDYLRINYSVQLEQRDIYAQVIKFFNDFRHPCRPGLSIRQTRQMPRAYEDKGPTKVIKEAHKSK